MDACLQECRDKPSIHKAEGFACNVVHVVPLENPMSTPLMFRNTSRCEGFLTTTVPPQHTQYRACMMAASNIPWKDVSSHQSNV